MFGWHQMSYTCLILLTNDKERKENVSVEVKRNVKMKRRENIVIFVACGERHAENCNI